MRESGWWYCWLVMSQTTMAMRCHAGDLVCVNSCASSPCNSDCCAVVEGSRCWCVIVVVWWWLLCSDDDDDDDDVVTEVDLSAVRAESRLNNSAALHRRAVRPQRQRPLTQYQPYTQTNVNHLFQVLRSAPSYLLTYVTDCHMVWWLVITATIFSPSVMPMTHWIISLTLGLRVDLSAVVSWDFDCTRESRLDIVHELHIHHRNVLKKLMSVVLCRSVVCIMSFCIQYMCWVVPCQL